MRAHWPLVLGGALVLACFPRWVQRPMVDLPPRVISIHHEMGLPESAVTPEPDELHPVALDNPTGGRAGGERGDIARFQEKCQARLREDPGFSDELFGAFMSESDPMWMSCFQNVLAVDPRRRNSRSWQERFVNVAEFDPSLDRRKTALLFLQQAESIGPVRARLLGLAQGGDLRLHALVALKGLPGRRLPDVGVTTLAAHMADHDPDPAVRGVAIRVEGDPLHALRLLADPHSTVRAQASRVVTSPGLLEKALRVEADALVRSTMERRLDSLRWHEGPTYP